MNYKFNALLKHPGFNDVGSAIGAGASLLGGVIGSKSAKDAADESSDATRVSNEILQQQADENTAAYSPYINLGAGSTAKLSDYLGISSQNPDYSRAENDYKIAQAEYERLLKAAGGNNKNQSYLYGPNSISQFYGGDINENFYHRDNPASGGGNSISQYGGYMNESFYHRDNPASGGGNDTLLANAKAKLDASYAKLNSTPRDSQKSKNFGSLLHNFDANDLKNDTVYNSGLQFGLNEGTKAINRLASANGGIDSGATLKALTRYANDYGSTKAQGAFQNFNTNKANIYNMLSGQSAQGLSATSSLQGNNSNLRTGSASNAIQNGVNQGNAAIASGAAWGNAINNGIGNYLYDQRTQQPSNGSVYGSGTGPNGAMSYNNSAWYNNNRMTG